MVSVWGVSAVKKLFSIYGFTPSTFPALVDLRCAVIGPSSLHHKYLYFDAIVKKSDYDGETKTNNSGLSLKPTKIGFVDRIYCDPILDCAMKR